MVGKNVYAAIAKLGGKGKVYYTQVPPQECLGKETQEMSRQGSITKSAGSPALTPEQQAAREEERKKQQEQEVAAREEKRKNQALLNTYSSEKDIEEARARAADPLAEARAWLAEAAR